MATWDRQTHYYSGQGVVLVGEYDTNGSVTGLTPVGNVTELKISIETSTTEHKESQSGQRLVDYQFPTETKAGLVMTMENFSRDILAMAFRGDYTAVDAASTAITKEITLYKGMVVPLEHIKVSEVSIKLKASPNTALTAYATGTADTSGQYDYEINLDAGSVRFAETLKASGLEDGDVLEVTYKHAAQAVVNALTKNAAPRFLRFEGLNTVDGDNPVIVEAFRFVLDPAKELALITAEDMASFEMEGALLADSSRTTGSKIFKQMLVR